ncbi:MAG: hypothetical protein MJK18_13830 [Bdellovibrionales bacterium]|nr:hypothetical protein [Bdellovibrionales bacterium]
MRILIVISYLALIGCGVKGNPLPPENLREIGIGKPQYKGVDAELQKTKDEDEKEKKK